VRLLDPANLRFQRRVARPGIPTVGSSARQIPDQGVGHVLLEQDPACRGHDLAEFRILGRPVRRAVGAENLLHVMRPGDIR
jgi:hypothetical protein